MNIRPAEEADIAEIRQVARTTWHATYDEFEPAMIDETVDSWYEDEEIADTLTNPGTVFLVAEKEGDIVGFTHGIAIGERGDILRMYVHPDHQRQGIGLALHERLQERLEDSAVTQLQSIDFSFNDAAREFYERLGFEKTGEGEVEIGGEIYHEAMYTTDLE